MMTYYYFNNRAGIIVFTLLILMMAATTEVAAHLPFRVSAQPPRPGEDHSRLPRTPIARTQPAGGSSGSLSGLARSSSEESLHSNRPTGKNNRRSVDTGSGGGSSGSLQYLAGTSPGHNRGRHKPSERTSMTDLHRLGRLSVEEKELGDEYDNTQALVPFSHPPQTSSANPLAFDYTRGPVDLGLEQVRSHIVAFGTPSSSSSTGSIVAMNRPGSNINLHQSSSIMTVPVSEKSAEELVEEERINCIVQSAFLESLAIEQQQKQPRNPFESLNRVAELHLTPDQLDRSLDSLSAGWLKKDINLWNKFMTFRDLLAQFLFYQSLFDSTTIHHALTQINFWSVHMTVPSLPMVFLSASIFHKIAENFEWMISAGIRQPFLKLTAEYVIRRRFDASPVSGGSGSLSASASASSQLSSSMRSGGGGANSRSSSAPTLGVRGNSDAQISEVANELHESSEELPTHFSKVKVALSNVDESMEMADGVQSAMTHERMIDADLSLSLVSGMHGAIVLADKVLPAETMASLDTVRVMPFLTGAHLVLNCIKIAMDPTVLMKEHTMLLTITVKTLDMMEQVQRAMEASESDQERR